MGEEFQAAETAGTAGEIVGAVEATTGIEPEMAAERPALATAVMAGTVGPVERAFEIVMRVKMVGTMPVLEKVMLDLHAPDHSPAVLLAPLRRRASSRVPASARNFHKNAHHLITLLHKIDNVAYDFLLPVNFSREYHKPRAYTIGQFARNS